MEKIDRFQNRLAKALSNKKMRAIELARKTGVNKSLISNYLKGGYEPKYENLTIIAKALNVSEVWLLGYDVPMDNKEMEDNTGEPVTEYLIESDILDQELAKKMVQVLVNEGKAIPAKRAYKIINIAKSMIENLAYIYYKD